MRTTDYTDYTDFFNIEKTERNETKRECTYISPFRFFVLFDVEIK